MYFGSNKTPDTMTAQTRPGPPQTSYSTSCCHGDGPSVKVDTQTLYNTMHQCGATILITEAVSPPCLPLGTITSTLALQSF